jgi:hypothetical protein
LSSTQTTATLMRWWPPLADVLAQSGRDVVLVDRTGAVPPIGVGGAPIC